MIEVTRGDFVESTHRGTVAVVDQDGRIKASWGDPMRPAFMRSSAKPFQALPLLDSGAAQEFRVRQDELALVCASHAGQERHLDVLSGLLQRVGVDESQLQCGVHQPHDKEAACELRAHGEGPTVLHNNCAGKHIGMLAACKHLGYPLEDYLSIDHPLQQRILGTLARLAQVEPEQIGLAIDGCSAPNFSIPIHAIALAYARLAAGKGEEGAPSSALAEIFNAMTQHPSLISGPEKFDALLMKAGQGDLLAKTGAEGVLAISLRGFESEGLGIAMKIWDGDKSGRARSAAALEILSQLGWLKDDQRAIVESVIPPEVKTRRGRKVGEVRPNFRLEQNNG